MESEFCKEASSTLVHLCEVFEMQIWLRLREWYDVREWSQDGYLWPTSPNVWGFKLVPNWRQHLAFVSQNHVALLIFRRGWVDANWYGSYLCSDGTRALLVDTKDFTLMIKNSIHFTKCGAQYQRRNIIDNATSNYLASCIYNPKINPYCPVFRIGDIVRWSGSKYDQVAIEVRESLSSHPGPES